MLQIIKQPETRSGEKTTPKENKTILAPPCLISKLFICTRTFFKGFDVNSFLNLVITRLLSLLRLPVWIEYFPILLAFLVTDACCLSAIRSVAIRFESESGYSLVPTLQQLVHDFKLALHGILRTPSTPIPDEVQTFSEISSLAGMK